MGFREVGMGMDWIELAQNRDRWWVLRRAVINLWVLPIKFGEFLD